MMAEAFYQYNNQHHSYGYPNGYAHHHAQQQPPNHAQQPQQQQHQQQQHHNAQQPQHHNVQQQHYAQQLNAQQPQHQKQHQQQQHQNAQQHHNAQLRQQHHAQQLQHNGQHQRQHHVQQRQHPYAQQRPPHLGIQRQSQHSQQGPIAHKDPVVYATSNTNSSNNNEVDTRVQRCNCCPYGYHIDLDFLNFCQEIASGANLKNIKKLKKTRPKHAPVKSIKPPPPIVPPRSVSLPEHRKRRNREKIEPNKILEEEQAAFSATLDKFTNVIRKRYMSESGDYTVGGRNRKASDTQSLPPYPNDISLSDVESQSSDIETASACQAPVTKTKRPSYRRHTSLPGGVDVELLSDMDINPNGSFSSQFSPSNLLQMSLQSESNSSLSSSTSSIPPHHRGTTDPLAMSMTQSFSSFSLPSTPGEMTPGSSGRSTPSQISSEALAAVRHQMVTALQRIKQLEEQIKAIPVLSVKVNVLKEEKRLLMMQLKAKEQGIKTRTIAVGDSNVDDYDASSEAELTNLENGHGEENCVRPSQMSAVGALHFHKTGKLKTDGSAKKAIVAPVPRQPVATRSVGVDASIPISPKKWNDTKSIGVNVNISTPVKTCNGALEVNGHKTGEMSPRPAMTLSVHRAVQLKSSPGIVTEDVIRASKADNEQSAFTPPRLTKQVNNTDSNSQTEICGEELNALINGAKSQFKKTSIDQSTSMESIVPHYVITGTNTNIIQTRIMATNTAPLESLKPQASTVATNTEQMDISESKEYETTATNTEEVEIGNSKPKTRDFGTFPVVFPGISKGVLTERASHCSKATETYVEAYNASTSTMVILTKDQAVEADLIVEAPTIEVEKVDQETWTEVSSSNAYTSTDGVAMATKGTNFCPASDDKSTMAEYKMVATECGTMTDLVETPIEIEPAIVVAVDCGVTESAAPPGGMFDKPEMVSASTSYDPVETVSVGTDYIPVETVSTGTDSASVEMISVGTEQQVIDLVSVGTEYTVTEMVSVGTEYTATEMVSVGIGHPVVEMVSAETDYEHAMMVSQGTEYTPVEMVSVATSHMSQGDMVSVGTTCGGAVELVSTGTGSNPIEMVSVETTYSPQEMVSVGTICNSASEMVSEETMYSPPEDSIKTVGVGHFSLYDNFCDRCDHLETNTQGVGECTLHDRVCDRCDNLVTATRGICTEHKEMKEVAISVDTNHWANHLGVGTCSINDLLCDKCSSLDTQTQGVGDCSLTDSLCDRCDNLETSTACVEAKPDMVSVLTSAKPEVDSVMIGVKPDSVSLATSVKPEVASVLTSASVMSDFSETIGTGSGSIDEVICDRCSNVMTSSIGVGDAQITASQDIGTNHDISTRTLGVGLDSKSSTSSKAIGERDVNEILCNACELKPNRTIGMAAMPETTETCVGNTSEELISSGSGDCTVLDRVCDRCDNIVTRSVAVGSTDITRYTFSLGVQAGCKVIHRASGTASPRLYEKGTMTDADKVQNSASIGVGKGDVSKYTSGFGVQVGRIGVESGTETTSIPVQEIATMTDMPRDSASPRSFRTNDSTSKSIAKEDSLIVKTENITVSAAHVSQSAAPSSPTRSRPRVGTPRHKPVPRTTSPRKIPDRTNQPAPKTPEILELEKRKRHSEDEPLRPPPEGVSYGASKITVGLPPNMSAVEASRRWSSSASDHTDSSDSAAKPITVSRSAPNTPSHQPNTKRNPPTHLALGSYYGDGGAMQGGFENHHARLAGGDVDNHDGNNTGANAQKEKWREDDEVRRAEERRRDDERRRDEERQREHLRKRGSTTDTDMSQNLDSTMSSMSSSSEDTESDSDSSSDSTTSSSSAEGTYDGKIARTFKKSQHLKNRHAMPERGRSLSKSSASDVEHRFSEINPEFLRACGTLEKLLEKPGDSNDHDMATCISTISKDWFRISSQKSSDPHMVADYLVALLDMGKAVLEKVINLTDGNGNTALHYAVSHGNFVIVEILLDSEVCNVDAPNRAGYSAIMLTSLATVLDSDQQVVVKKLFRLGDVDMRAAQAGQTALMLAVSHGKQEMVKQLLEAGADVNIQDEDGSTALMCASEHGHLEIVKLLLGHPMCDATLMDNDGSTAFSIAMEAGHKDIGVLLYAQLKFGKSLSPKRKSHGSPSPYLMAASPALQRRTHNLPRSTSASGLYPSTSMEVLSAIDSQPIQRTPLRDPIRTNNHRSRSVSPSSRIPTYRAFTMPRLTSPTHSRCTTPTQGSPSTSRSTALRVAAAAAARAKGTESPTRTMRSSSTSRSRTPSGSSMTNVPRSSSSGAVSVQKHSSQATSSSRAQMTSTRKAFVPKKSTSMLGGSAADKYPTM